jgi:lipid-A-disaccharide synthase
MRIAIFAGETSGDVLGAGLIAALRERLPAARFEGIAGPRMLALGCESLYPMDRLAVMGLVEVAGRYPEIMRLRGRLARRYLADPPDVYIGIDAPDFNLHLQMRLRRAGIPTVHYVSPSVWAWRRYRIRKIRAGVDRMLVLFPFEQAFYAGHGVDARFVGHPLADAIEGSEDTAAARRRLGLPARVPVVALLPGSRMMELDALADVMVGAAHWLAGRREAVRFVVPLVDYATRQRFQRAIDVSPGRAQFALLDGDAHTAMEAADVVLLASGTASLEALLLDRPMVITYRTHPLTWAIGRRLLHVPHVGLPNLLAGRAIVAELLQGDATPRRLGAEVLALLDSGAARAAQREAFRGIAHSLRNDASARAADAVVDLLQARA